MESPKESLVGDSSVTGVEIVGVQNTNLGNFVSALSRGYKVLAQHIHRYDADLGGEFEEMIT